MRQWLLGLCAAACLAPGAALADSRQDVVNLLARCAVLNDDRQWLDCYYGAAQPMRSQLGLSAAPQASMSVLHDAMGTIPTRVAPLAATGAVAAAPAIAAAPG